MKNWQVNKYELIKKLQIIVIYILWLTKYQDVFENFLFNSPVFQNEYSRYGFGRYYYKDKFHIFSDWTDFVGL